MGKTFWPAAEFHVVGLAVGRVLILFRARTNFWKLALTRMRSWCGSWSIVLWIQHSTAFLSYLNLEPSIGWNKVPVVTSNKVSYSLSVNVDLIRFWAMKRILVRLTLTKVCSLILVILVIFRKRCLLDWNTPKIMYDVWRKLSNARYNASKANVGKGNERITFTFCSEVCLTSFASQFKWFVFLALSTIVFYLNGFFVEFFCSHSVHCCTTHQ